MNAPSDATVNTAADRVAVAVTRCRTVARMSGGRFEEIATYLPGRRVLGVIIRATTPRPEVEVHVVGRYGPTMKQIFREVEAAVRSVLPKHRTLITIDDLEIPAASPPKTDQGRPHAT